MPLSRDLKALTSPGLGRTRLHAAGMIKRFGRETRG